MVIYDQVRDASLPATERTVPPYPPYPDPISKGKTPSENLHMFEFGLISLAIPAKIATENEMFNLI